MWFVFHCAASPIQAVGATTDSRFESQGKLEELKQQTLKRRKVILFMKRHLSIQTSRLIALRDDENELAHPTCIKCCKH